MTLQEQHLIEQAHLMFEKGYDEDFGLLGKGTNRHGTRASANYALTLLMTGGSVERAEKVIRAIIDCQYQKEGRVYFGTFKRFPEEAEPCVNAVVWDDYDANWRDFIGLTFAVILEEFKDKLSDETVKLMERSAFCAVTSSVCRYYDRYVPMQTNIEIMSLFIADYFGEYFGDERLTYHAKGAAMCFLEKFKKTDTMPEFNSPTYYSVDFFALALMVKYSKNAEVIEMAEYVLDKTWESASNFYNPSLENFSGPFSRSYEMEMLEHSSMGAIIYKCLKDEKYRHLAVRNTETFSDPLMVLSQLEIPEKYLSRFTGKCEEREIKYSYNELLELFPVYHRYNLCNCTAYLRENLMIGAARDAKNTSAQLHPATIYWKHENELYWIRLARRRADKKPVPHHWHDAMNCTAKKDNLTIDIDSTGDDDREFFFEMHGKKIHSSKFEADKWILPGLTLDVDMIAENVTITKTKENRLEMSIIHSGEVNKKIKVYLSGFYQD